MEDYVTEFFDCYDLDGDGFLTRKQALTATMDIGLSSFTAIRIVNALVQVGKDSIPLSNLSQTIKRIIRKKFNETGFRRIFEFADIDGVGILDEEEVRNILDSIGIESNVVIDAFFQRMKKKLYEGITCREYLTLVRQLYPVREKPRNPIPFWRLFAPKRSNLDLE